MPDKEAKIRLSLDGQQAQEVARQIQAAYAQLGQSLTDAFRQSGEQARQEAEKSKGAWDGVKSIAVEAGKALGAEVRSIGRDLGGVVLQSTKLDFAAARAGAVRFEEDVTRIAVASGQGARDLEGKYRQLGESLGEQPQAIASFATQLGRLSYDFRGAEDAARGFRRESIADGRSLDSYLYLGTILRQNFGITGDVTDALGRLRAQAEDLRTIGGPAALKDQLASLGPVLSRLGGLSEETLPKFTGFLGALGKGYGPAAAQRVQQSLLGDVTNNVRGYERALGYRVGELTDDKGQLKQELLPEITERLRSYVLRRAGGDKQRARTTLAYRIGPESAAAVLSFDRAEAERLSKVAPSQEAQRRESAFSATATGRRLAAEARKNIELQRHVGEGSVFGDAADLVKDQAGKHPITAGFIGGTVGRAVATPIGAAVVGSFGVGAAAGSYLDRKVGVSDYYSELFLPDELRVAKRFVPDLTPPDEVERRYKAAQGHARRYEVARRASLGITPEGGTASAEGGVDYSGLQRAITEALSKATLTVPVTVHNQSSSPVTATANQRAGNSAGRQ